MYKVFIQSGFILIFGFSSTGMLHTVFSNTGLVLPKVIEFQTIPRDLT